MEGNAEMYVSNNSVLRHTFQNVITQFFTPPCTTELQLSFFPLNYVSYILVLQTLEFLYWMGDIFIRYIILRSVSAQLRNQFMPLTVSAIKYLEIFLWEMLPPYSLLHTFLLPNHLFIALFHVLKFYQIIFFFKKVHQVVVGHKRFYKNLKKFPVAISNMWFCDLWSVNNR